MLLDETKAPEQKTEPPATWRQDREKAKKVVRSVSNYLAKKDKEIAVHQDVIKQLRQDQKEKKAELKAMGIKVKNFDFAYRRRDLDSDTRQVDDEEQSFCCEALDVQLDLFQPDGEDKTRH